MWQADEMCSDELGEHKQLLIEHILDLYGIRNVGLVANLPFSWRRVMQAWRETGGLLATSLTASVFIFQATAVNTFMPRRTSIWTPERLSYKCVRGSPLRRNSFWHGLATHSVSYLLLCFSLSNVLVVFSHLGKQSTIQSSAGKLELLQARRTSIQLHMLESRLGGWKLRTSIHSLSSLSTLVPSSWVACPDIRKLRRMTHLHRRGQRRSI